MNETNSESARASAGSIWAIPVAIIIGFGLIAAAVYFGGARQPATVTTTPEATGGTDLSALAPVTADDHIRGNPMAPIVIVEYSDFDCPFCQRFHTTMQRIMDEYGANGDVAWVYRHLPLTSLHPSAAHIAEASECVAEFGGDEAFWKFADMVFGERGSNGATDLIRLPEFAESAGVSKTNYESCVASGRHRQAVNDDAGNAAALGVNGTPYSVILVGDQRIPIEGARPYEEVKVLIDGLVR